MNSTLKMAVDIVLRAGQMAEENFRRCTAGCMKSHGDIATEIDLKIDEFIVASLKKAFAGHGILSEESGHTAESSDWLWLLDPIDGSKHYARGNPLYGISLALKYRGRLQLGVVHVPRTREIFTARKDNGAYLNGNPMAPGSIKRIRDAIVCVEIPSRHNRTQTLDSGLERLKRIVLNCQRVRIIGVSSLGMCYCATGAFDAYVNLGTFSREWDVAAGMIILAEAGCRVEKIDGAILGTSAELFEPMRNLLR